MRSRNWISRLAVSLPPVLAMVGCGEAPELLPAQSWAGIEIQVETRPPLVESGMNEFLIIATRERRKPAHDLVVSLRVDDDGRWQQAIQDGHVGVYRRALPVRDPARATLHVRLQQGSQEGQLRFELGPIAAGAAAASGPEKPQ